MRLVTDDERRARLGIRHALARSASVGSPEEAAGAVVCLHATEPASVHLSCWARVGGLEVDDVERALYDTRSLVRQQAMRETLFVFPRDLVPAVWGSASARAAAAHRKRLIKDLERWGPADDGHGDAWLTTAENAVLACLADGVPRPSRRIREEVPEASGVIDQAPHKSWGGRIAIAPRVLTQLSLDGTVARAGNAGAWYTSHPTWTTARAWWGQAVPEPLGTRQGYAELVARWLWSYGPGTIEDVAWWLGGTRSAVRTALDDIRAQQVSLADGSVGWLREDDLDPVDATESWVALLPPLDPTVMGWRGRAFYLGPHGPQLFDSVGNAGTTTWVDGRVVGAWVQDPEGMVQLRLLDDDISPAAHEALAAEARRLGEWLGGRRVFTYYPSPAMQPEPGR